MTEPIGLKLGATIELSLIKGCPTCTNNQFYVIAGTPGQHSDFYWMVCSNCGNKRKISHWPFGDEPGTDSPE